MICAGIGYRRAATLADLQEALALTGITPDALASIAAKADSPPLQDLARQTGLPLITLSEAEIAGIRTLTHSPRLQARFGTGSLAEAAALAAAGRDAQNARTRLLAPRVQTANGMATAAIAERISP